MEVLFGILIPFIGTALGSACVFFMKKSLGDLVQRSLAGFAAGVMGYHYQLVDGYVKFVLTERKFGPKTDAEGMKKRETAAASFEKVVQDGRKRFSSFKPTSQDQYKSTIGNYILTLLPVWMQYRNTYITV